MVHHLHLGTRWDKVCAMMSQYLRSFFAAVLLLPAAAQAQYSFTTNRDGTLNVASYTGSDGAVTVPDTENGVPITTIGPDAFFKLANLTSVTLGTNIGIIGTNAFFQCPVLATAIIPASATNIGLGPFADCQSLAVISVNPSNAFYVSTNNLLFNKSLTSLIQFPNGVGGGYEIPANVNNIGAAFEGNTLTGIAVDPANLYYSATNGVLFNKAKTQLVSYPGNLTGFYVVPSSVNTIQSAAFEYSPALVGVVIGSNVVNIGAYALYDCTALQVISVDTNNFIYSSTNGVLFNKNGTELIQFPSGFVGSYAVPGTVTTIENGAFGDAFNLVDVEIPASVTSIGEETFYGCLNLANITFDGNGLATIGANAFYECENLSSISLPNSLTNIAESAFFACTGLAYVTVGDGVQAVGSQAFAECFALQSILFTGNAPTADQTVFEADPVTVYYEPGTSGWQSTLGGAPAVMYNPPIPAGMLQVTINPNGADNAGAQWEVDGGVPQPSGAIVLGLTVATHTVSFIAVNGWTPPANQTVTVYENTTTTASGTYTVATPTGSLTVNIQPAGATNAGAQWQVDNGSWLNSGATVSGLSVAQHTVSFSTISDWTTPANQTVTITNNATTTVTGTYAIIPTGSLTVNIQPAGATNAGAQWQVDGGAYLNSGATVSGLSVARQHTVGFSTISGWTTPASKTVSVSANSTASVTGTYVQQFGSLEVTINPQAAATAGAKWQVDGGALEKSGATVGNLSLGLHTLSFTTVSGYTAPASQTVTVTANTTTPASGTYVAVPASGSLQVTITPATLASDGAQWQVDSGTPLNSGAVATVTAGTHSVTFSGLNFWNSPASQNVTIKAKATTKATGAYTFKNQGVYNGLFSQSSGVTEATAGMLSNLKIGAQGTYTATLLLAGGTYNVVGAFNSNGTSSTNVARSTALGGPLALQIGFNGNSPAQITGTVSGTSGGGWKANLLANPTAKTGSAEYTVLLAPSQPVAAGVPPGDGYLLITNHAGVLLVTGSLADGTSLTATSQSVAIDAMGDVPIYDSLYSKTGLLTGWINLTNLNGTPGLNTLTWIKPATKTAALYPNGFTSVLQVQGEPWIAPAAKTPAIPLNDGILIVSNIGLYLTYNVGVSNNSALVKLPSVVTNSLTGSITTKNGLLTVTFGDGPGKTTVTGTGAVLQNANSAGGFFLGKTNAGSIILQP
jgi:BspA type Leucine rich repeat region (6 copies)